MRIVVTGGAGFIGANLCRYIESREIADVVVLDDLSTGSVANLVGTRARFVQGSILDADALDEAFAGSDVVVHLAALPSVPRSLHDPLASHAVNATGTVMVLDAGRRHGLGQVILASSSSVYGKEGAGARAESQPTRPLSPYAASKAALEGYARAYASSFGLPALVFRLFNVFGPLQRADHAYAAVVPKFIASALRGDDLIVEGDGNQTRDFTFVETVCAVIARAATENIVSDEPVNLALGTSTTVNELAQIVLSSTASNSKIVHTDARVGDVRSSQADPAHFSALFPEAPRAPLQDGVVATVDWYRSSTGLGLDRLAAC